MFTHTESAPKGFSVQKTILRLLMLGALGLTIFYAKTIGVFLRVFVRELMATPKKE
jgi:hypothetical protein